MVRKPDKLDSGGRLINVEFKHGKKMKKRRELDALVSNGKARRKTRSGHELLRNESDSSEIEEFSSPDAKVTVRNRRGGSFCGTCLTVLAFLLLLSCIVVCAGLIWVHLELKTELDILKGRIQSAENSNQGIPSELGNIKSQIQDWNKTLQGYRSGSHGLDEVIKNMTTLSKNVKKLQMLLTEIRDKKKQNPAKSSTNDNSVAQSVANIGADVETLKTKHTDLETSTKERFQTLQDRITQLENQLSLLVVPPTQGPGTGAIQQDTASKALTSQVNLLQASLQSMNSSVYGQISGLTQEISTYENRFVTLESEVHKPPVPVNTTAILINLRDTLKSYIQSELSGVNKSAGLQSEVVLNTIRDEVKNISQTVGILEQQISTDQVSETASSDYVKLVRTITVLNNQLNNTDATVMNLNNSFTTMEKTVEKLMDLYIKEKNMIVNLTSVVDGVRRYLHRIENLNEHHTTEGGGAEVTTHAPDDASTTETSPKSSKVQARRDTSKTEVEKLFE